MKTDLQKYIERSARLRNFPPLIGTEKQKKWAESLRAKVVKDLSLKDVKLVRAFERGNHAEFWIDTRFLTPAQIMDRIRTAARLTGKLGDLMGQVHSAYFNDQGYANKDLREYRELTRQRDELKSQIDNLFRSA